ncbi:MMPL family transporter [Candidatus Sumerlaeota bacterium]|nr:MMPL family transporter [Candidatus Sumerlaeota bacterium]
MPSSPERSPVRFFDFLERHRGWVLALCGASVALFLVWARGIVWREDILDLLPDRDPVVEDYRRILQSFRPTDQMCIEIGPADASAAPPDEERSIAVADALAARLEAAAGGGEDSLFDKIRYRYAPESGLEALDFLRAHRAALFTEDDARRIERKLDPESIRAALANWRKILAQSPAPTLSQRLARDPLYFDESLVDRLNALQAMRGGVRVHRGRLFSEDLRHILIVAQPRFPSTDSHHAKDLIAYADAAVSEALREAAAPDLRIAYVAGHRFGLENAERIKRDLKLTIGLSVVGILILSFLAYRRFLFSPLTILPAAFGAAFASGLVRWIAPDISAISIGCGSMLIGIAVDYGIHVLYRADQELDSGSGGPSAMSALLGRLAKPIALCAATTVFAFATLLLSVMPGYRHLGLFAMLGILGAAGFSLTVLPLLVRLGREPRRRAPLLSLSGFFGWAIDGLSRRRGLVLCVLVATTLVAVAGVARVRFEGDYRKLNAASDSTQEELERVTSVFGNAMESVSLAVVGEDVEDALRRNETVYAELARRRDAGIVTGIRSLSPFFPSRRTQEENIARWREFWTPERIQTLRDDLTSAALAQRIRPETFEPFLSALSGPAPLIDPNPEGTGLLGDLLETQRTEDQGQTLLLTSVGLSDPDRFADVVEGLERVEPGILAASGRDFMRYLVHLISSELARMGSLALGLILLLLIVVVRRPARIALLASPVLLCVVWMFGALGWLDVRINLMNSIVCVFVFGLAIDYSIFLVGVAERAGATQDGRLGRTGGAVTLSALTTLIGLGALTVATHPVLREIGATTLIGIAGGWLAALLVVSLSRTTTE